MPDQNALDLLVKKESEFDEYATGENYADDLDMVLSPKDGKLVAVAVVGGVHVCWHCFEQFIEDPSHKLRSVEYNCGGYGTRIHLHAKCVPRKASKGVWAMFWKKVSGHQARREHTRLTKPFKGLGG